jgi:hypothetical protein
MIAIGKSYYKPTLEALKNKIDAKHLKNQLKKPT